MAVFRHEKAFMVKFSALISVSGKLIDPQESSTQMFMFWNGVKSEDASEDLKNVFRVIRFPSDWAIVIQPLKAARNSRGVFFLIDLNWRLKLARFLYPDSSAIMAIGLREFNRSALA